MTIALAAACFSTQQLSAQRQTVTRLDDSKISPEQIDGTVTKFMAAGHVTGAGIAIFNEGKVVYLKAYGFRDKERNLPLTPDSIMTAASLTKSAFATVVMQLVHEHLIDLDKPVYKYLPKPLPQYENYKDLAGDERYKLITMRMLLSHTAGFANWRWLTDANKLRIYFTPGTRFAYSGEGIDLAQLIAETVTHKSINQLMRARLFQPLHMTRSSMSFDKRFANNQATRYDEHEKSLGPEHREKADAAGSMQTTLRDYSRLVQAVLSGSFLGPDERNEMLSPQIWITSKHEFPSLENEPTKENNAIHLSYGLGWGLYLTKYGEVFFKEGHDEGWRNYVACFDQPKTGLLIMTNSSNGEDIYSGLLENLIGDTFTPLEWERFKPSANLHVDHP